MSVQSLYLSLAKKKKKRRRERGCPRFQGFLLMNNVVKVSCFFAFNELCKTNLKIRVEPLSEGDNELF